MAGSAAYAGPAPLVLPVRSPGARRSGVAEAMVAEVRGRGSRGAIPVVCGVRVFPRASGRLKIVEYLRSVVIFGGYSP